jgi:SAM-dependent methyltransferase
MNCPLCKSEAKNAFTAMGFQLLDCASCGHRFADVPAGEAHVAATYGDEYFSGGGAGYPDYLSEAELLRQRGLMYAKKVAKFARTGRMLDVGAAAGFILKGFEEAGWTGMGLEPNEAMCRYGREQLGLTLRGGSLENFALKTFAADENFDLISMIQVAAHFYDPRGAFAAAAKLLKRDGLLLVETWDRDSFTARVLGKNWHEYSPPSVLHWYSRQGLDNFLRQFGLARVAGGRPAKWISGAHARSLLEYRLGRSFLLSLIPTKLSFPYPAEDLFWALYRKR